MSNRIFTRISGDGAVYAITAIVVVATVTIGGALAVGTVSPQGSPQATEINSCTVIDEPGRYVLTENLTDAYRDHDDEPLRCLRIQASDVVVDGQGNSVYGNDSRNRGAFSAAVVVATRDETLENVTVRNFETAGQWDQSIVYQNVEDSTISDVTIPKGTGNKIGIKIVGSRTIAVSNAAITVQGDGIQFTGSQLTVRDSLIESSQHSILVDGDGQNRIVGNVFTGGSLVAIELDSPDTLVADNQFTGVYAAIRSNTPNSTIRNNTIENWDDFPVGITGDGSQVVGNTFESSDEHSPVAVSGNNTLVARNDLRGAGIVLSSAHPQQGAVVRNNSISGEGATPDPTRGISVAGPGITVVDNQVDTVHFGVALHGNVAGTVVRDNTITNNSRAGVGFRRENEEDINGTVEILGNTITENQDGISIPDIPDRHPDESSTSTDELSSDGDCENRTTEPEASEPGPQVSIHVHRNTIANNERFGINNKYNRTVNATNNYWGAADGPSSPVDEDAPFQDPTTGELADGNGDAISEGPEAGVSNVHFAPYLTAES